MTSDPNPLARKLGYAGLIPFLGGALFIWLLVDRVDPEVVSFVAQAVAAYAAVVISFLGGMLWGLSMPGSQYQQDAIAPQRPALWAGVAYSLAAWIAALMPPHAGLVVLGVLLIVCYLSDRKRYHELQMSGWLTMRFRLTVAASLSCFLSAAQI
ncbi:MAG TPA: DUF3429 domain-containing protein [Aquabacterium sp.]|nr:DUF3429 domain-containing protein [Aquabacterium sp.]